MLDIKFIRENREKVKKATEVKGGKPEAVDKVLEIDEKRRELLQEVEDLRADRNKAAKERDKQKGAEIKSKLQKIEPELKKVEKEFQTAMYRIPNVIASDVPLGKDESENKELRKWGEKPKFDFRPKDHLELGETLDIIDVKRAAKISGTRFGYLKGDAALLQFALIQFTLEVLTDKEIIGEIAKKVGNKYDTPFTPIVPPVIAKSEIMKRMDRFDPIDDRYYLEKDDALLIGSAEHTLGPMHMDKVFSEKDLPIRYLGYSTSFRREAGTYGKDTRGIFRVHQFDKLEMENFTKQDDGEKEQEFIVAIQEYLMQKLEIPYRVVILCAGEMGKPDYRQIDIEAWLPSQEKYRETHTSDYMTDYQSRRLNTKVGQDYVHMNDATAFAIGRTIIAIMENNQQKDGSIKVPKVLQKWMGKERINRSK